MSMNVIPNTAQQYSVLKPPVLKISWWSSN